MAKLNEISSAIMKIGVGLGSAAAAVGLLMANCSTLTDQIGDVAGHLIGDSPGIEHLIESPSIETSLITDNITPANMSLCIAEDIYNETLESVDSFKNHAATCETNSEILTLRVEDRISDAIDLPDNVTTISRMVDFIVIHFIAMSIEVSSLRTRTDEAEGKLEDIISRISGNTENTIPLIEEEKE